MISPKSTSILSHLPSFYRSDDDRNVLYRLLEAYAAQLEGAENDLIRVMHSHWSHKANNEGSDSADAQQRGDLDKIFALWLESLGGTALLRQTGRRPSGQGGEADDAAYLERILALIEVIRRGASTVEGIRAVVAANLGIIGNDPAARYAREQIRIEEYLPTADPVTLPNQRLYTPFSITNPNPVHTPVGFVVRVTGTPPVPLVGLYLELPALRQTLGCAASLVKDDVLFLFYDKTALLNGQKVPTTGTGIQLPPGVSQLQVGAKLGYPQGQFGSAPFDRATFDIELAEAMGRFDAEAFDQASFALLDPVIEVKALLYKVSPGAFTVTVPWDSPGFTSAFRLPAMSRAVLEKLGFAPPAGFEEKTYESLAELLSDDWFGFEKTVAEREAALAALVPILIQSENDRFWLPPSAKEVLAPLGFTPPAGFEVKKYNSLTELAAENWLLAKRETEAVHAALEAIAPIFLPGEDRFRLMETNPRAQIKPIVDRVRAAGVYAVINYEKRFAEWNDLSDLVVMSAEHRTLTEDIGMHPKTHDQLRVLTLQKPDPETHDIGDGLTLSMMLDLTQFDSLNGFG